MHPPIKAFADLAVKIDGVELHICGDGPQREELQQLVSELGLQAKIFFYGYVDEHRLRKELRMYNVFIQHSLRREGVPVSIAKVMASGLPVVATAVSGIAEQVHDGRTAFLIAENDVSVMAVAMGRQAHNDNLRRNLGRAARDLAVTAYDAAHRTRMLKQVLLDVARFSPHMPEVAK